MTPEMQGVLIGGTISFAATALTSLVSIGLKAAESRRDRLSLEAGIKAEIAALIRIVDARDHVGKAERLIKTLREGIDHHLFAPGAVGTSPTPVFDANVDKIGLFGAKLAQDVVTFYMTFGGIRVNMASLSSGQFAALPLADRANIIESDLRLWHEIREIGVRLCPSLARGKVIFDMPIK